MGERLNIGEMDKWTEDEHVARYKYASKFTGGRSVIDAACGSGYGSLLIAESGAKDVVGVDISEQAMATAKSKYVHPSLKFFALNVEELSQLGTEIADAVVSFETIEHVSDDSKFLTAVHRVLRKGGIFIVSTHERRCGGIKERLTRVPGNPFHRREYTRDEFVKLVGQHFVIDEVLGQNQIPKVLTYLPIAVLVRAGMRLLSMAGIRRFRDLYLHGTGKELVSERMCARGMPKFWVIRCHK